MNSPMLSPADDPLLPLRPWTVCFYSYRGGVGRTTLAVSTAFNLHSHRVAATGGVALLDFDLEAPGVDEFPVCSPADTRQPGLIEMIAEFRANGTAPNLERFVYPIGKMISDGAIVEGRFIALPERFHKDFDVLRAGRRDDQYRRQIATLDWSDFYTNCDGYLFFENLRLGLKKRFGTEFLLVDSRPGLSEIGGVCLGHLADAVVLVFQPTNAHTRGLQAVVEAIKAREQRERRHIPRLYVASRIPWVYADHHDPDALQRARATLALCEGFAEDHVEFLDVPHEPGDPELSNPVSPLLHAISTREKVRNPDRIESYLVTPSEDAMSESESEYLDVAIWAEATRPRAE